MEDRKRKNLQLGTAADLDLSNQAVNQDSPAYGDRLPSCEQLVPSLNNVKNLKEDSHTSKMQGQIDSSAMGRTVLHLLEAFNIGTREKPEVLDPKMNDFQDIQGVEKIHMISPLLALMKNRMMTRVMNDFMEILKENWTSTIRTRTSVPQTNENTAGPSGSQTLSRVSASNTSRVCRRKDEGDDIPSDGDGTDDDQRTPKRPRTSHTQPDTQKSGYKFACPYRKHDPRKYCVQEWGPCALTPLASISRVK